MATFVKVRRCNGSELAPPRVFTCTREKNWHRIIGTCYVPGGYVLLFRECRAFSSRRRARTMSYDAVNLTNPALLGDVRSSRRRAESLRDVVLRKRESRRTIKRYSHA